MPRKRAASLQEQRTEIRQRYRRGKKQERTVVGDDALTQVEREVKLEIACYLKAMDFGHKYIAAAIGVSTSTLNRWLSDPRAAERIAEISADFVTGAIKYLKTYAIELIEMLVELARTTEDDQVALKAICEALDRIGISKVNKSESISAQTIREEIDLTDKAGLVAALREAPPEVQAKAAEKLEEMIALVGEHGEINVGQN
jgi:transcriptional regulator with XRE-family HTH domain